MKRSIFLTAGFPSVEATSELIPLLEKSGIDFIELGIPFSDPVADGPVIQKSSLAAIHNGVTVSSVFAIVHAARAKGVTMPIYLMGYVNPVLQFGLEKFLAECRKGNVTGLILPDITPEEYIRSYQTLFNEYSVDPIFLVTPVTSDDRIKYIASLSKIFLYAVSGMSITGGALGADDSRAMYLQRLQSLKLSVPVIVGFGLKNRTDLQEVSKYCDGGIIGSAFVDVIDSPDYIQRATQFVNSL